MENQEIVKSVNSSTGEEKNSNLSIEPVKMSKEFSDNISAKVDKFKDAVKKGKYSTGISITPKYYEFTEKGDKTQGVFLGYRQSYKQNTPEKIAQGEPETIEMTSALWMDAEKNVWMNSGVIPVDAFKILSISQPFEIEYLGQKKTQSGGYMKQYDIRPIFID